MLLFSEPKTIARFVAHQVQEEAAAGRDPAGPVYALITAIDTILLEAIRQTVLSTQARLHDEGKATLNPPYPQLDEIHDCS